MAERKYLHQNFITPNQMKMEGAMERGEYRSWQIWEDRFIGNLAVFCTDERFVTATSELLRNALGMERCDLLVIAGGPAFIAQGEENLIERLRLLVASPKIHHTLFTKRVVGRHSVRSSRL